MQHEVTAGSVTLGRTRPFVLIAGPCAIESREHARFMSDALVQLTTRMGIPFIYKSSFDKANRTSGGAARGVGMAQGLDILAEVKARHGCPVLTDIHERSQCAPVAEVVDVLQIPAFLCRQTDLLVAAAETGAVVNVKKGQFLAPWDMQNVARKLEDAGAKGILVTDRGTSFGYNTLVTDFRGLHYLEATGWPVVFDATHSVQQPGGLGGASGGQRMFVPILARAAVSLGVASVFMETHDRPDKALSDGPNQVPLDRLEEVLGDLLAFDRLAKSRPLPKLA
ncbi:MAG TPA: 3-deoxy-8-phosphooctulonate synthase [Geminicoccus sp.]|jgi:2-dehydro-3-deoxyphosphooctonate aldolase (KDO 8-P synthase)|uniref:3-deoxy-8-phosphooctulonate synthase n=1 Tax=Geminicoccus sp. TaxID=2024832 RepID=UPI002E35741F|nr:3-deoxy-8-phosphooctulonate synthase [Geminicoccus sp.]HEX2527684.1 3-deoxy-8-phosphooctulonate synthase [Geminicoccus sp.]